MSVVLRYIDDGQNVGSDITAQSISFEANYVFKKLQLEDFDFISVNVPCSTDTKDGSACESLKLLEIHITALGWIMLMRNMGTERNLTI